jgi:DNA-binding NarL/FixJ family response regulator
MAKIAIRRLECARRAATICRPTHAGGQDFLAALNVSAQPVAEELNHSVRSFGMRVADVRNGALHRPQPDATLVAGGDATARRRIARLLADADFIVREDPSSLPPELILALLIHTTDAQRVGEVRGNGQAHPDARILAVMPAGIANASMRRVLLAGAAGIVLDDDLERTLVATARATLAGQLAVPPVLGSQIAPRPLSHREKQILALVTLGRTNREIADQLYLAESTVKTHLSSAFRKLDARSRSEAINRIMDPDNTYGRSILDIANASVAAAG